MLAGAPPEMLDRWMAYYQVEPFGQARGDLQAGMICASLHNIAMAKAGEVGDRSPGDYLLKFGEEESERDAPTVEELETKLSVWAQAVNSHFEQA